MSVTPVAPFAVDGVEVAASPRPGDADVGLSVAPGQAELGAVVVTAQEPWDGLSVTFTEATGPTNSVLPPSAFEAWTLKTWQQAGRGIHVSTPLPTAELLVKDENLELRDTFMPDGRYQPPPVRLTGAPVFSLRPGESKRVVFRVHAPAGTGSGPYRGRLEIRSGERVVRAVSLRVDVMPIALVSPGQDRLIYYRGRLDQTAKSDYVGEQLLVAHLSDIRAHGFTGITLYDDKRPFLLKAATLARQAGFRGPLIFMEPSADAMQVAREVPGPIYFYGVDEPNTVTRFENHLRRARVINDAGFQVMTAVSRAYAIKLPMSGSPTALAVATYNLDRDFYDYVEALRGGRRSRDGRREWYYWPSMLEKPNLSRILTGFYLWASGLDGICPYAYQHIPAAPLSPYDPRDSWVNTYRMVMTTYPARDGAIPTIQWEAMRAGANDLQFVVTLEHALEQSRRPAHPATERARAAATQVLQRVREVIAPRVNDADRSTREPYAALKAGDYDELRRQIADAIMALTRESER